MTERATSKGFSNFKSERRTCLDDCAPVNHWANERSVATKKLAKAAVPEVLAKLGALYPDAKTELDFRNAYEILTATILSAQTTDKRVNLTTPELFAKYPTPAELAKADPAEVETIIRPTGFYRNKTKSIIGMAKALVEKHGGEVPRTLEELVKIPGAARKTANVVLGAAFGIASGIAVDTHVQRLSQLIGLTDNNEPKDIERDLMQLVPQDRWIDVSHYLILHGRRVCVARRPQCDACVINTLCASAFDPRIGYTPKDADPVAEPIAKKKKVVVETKASRAARAIKKKVKKKSL